MPGCRWREAGQLLRDAWSCEGPRREGPPGNRGEARGGRAGHPPQGAGRDPEGFILTCNRPTVLAQGGFERLSAIKELQFLLDSLRRAAA